MTLGGKHINIFILLTANWNLAFPSIIIIGNNYNSINIPVTVSPIEFNNIS